MKLPPPEVGPKVDVTVPLEAPGKTITCLKEVDRTDQGTSKSGLLSAVSRTKERCKMRMV